MQRLENEDQVEVAVASEACRIGYAEADIDPDRPCVFGSVDDACLVGVDPDDIGVGAEIWSVIRLR